MFDGLLATQSPRVVSVNKLTNVCLWLISVRSNSDSEFPIDQGKT